MVESEKNNQAWYLDWLHKMKRGVMSKHIVCRKQGEYLISEILQPHNILTVAGMLLREIDMVMKPEEQHKLDTMTKSKKERQCKLNATRNSMEERRHKLDTPMKLKEERQRKLNMTAKQGEQYQLRTMERPEQQHKLGTTETLKRQRRV